MAELVDASVLGTDRAICEGSSPFRPTILLVFFKTNVAQVIRSYQNRINDRINTKCANFVIVRHVSL